MTCPLWGQGVMVCYSLEVYSRGGAEESTAQPTGEAEEMQGLLQEEAGGQTPVKRLGGGSLCASSAINQLPSHFVR